MNIYFGVWIPAEGNGGKDYMEPCANRLKISKHDRGSSICCWMVCPGSVILDPSHYHPDYTTLIIQQNAIGWNNLFKGRFSQEWSHIQEVYLKDNNLRERTRSGHIWVTTMTNTLWQQWMDLWKLRNDDRHGRDAATKAQALHEQVIREITLLYEKKNDVLAVDRDLFDVPLETRMEEQPQRIRQWIHTYGPLIKLSIRDATNVVTDGVRRITDYFSRPGLQP